MYVIHICKNKKCNNCWIDKDLTNAQSRPPSWKYCESCCEEKGIDFNSQRFETKPYQKEKIELMQKIKLSKVDDCR